MSAPAQFLVRYTVCECVDVPCELLFEVAFTPLVSAYPRCPCAGFYRVKEYTCGFIPCARRRVCSVHELPYSDRFS